jgi:GTP1/Obg family GTP-binding protein
MFFKRKKDDVDDIKEAMAGPVPEFQEIHQYHEKPREDFAPLFVKVEKYRELLAAIAEIKMFISGMKQLFVIINDLEALRTDANKIMRATIQRLEKSITEIDSELLRPRGFEVEFPAAEIEVHQIEDSLTELQKQMASLKRELEGMK